MKIIGTIEEADIIKTNWNTTINPDKQYIIQAFADYNLPQSFIKNYSKNDNIIFSFNKRTEEEEFKNFTYSTPVSSFTELNNNIDLGVSFAYIAEPLSFSLNLLPVDKVKFIIKPTVSNYINLPKANMLHTQWIRPEDLVYYEGYIYALDFSDESEETQKLLIKIYKEEEYNGDISDLYSYLPQIKNNYLQDLGEKRRFCGLRCERSYDCQICDRLFRLPGLREKTKEAIQKFNEKVGKYNEL